jgi:prevent-host-death family protein
MPTYSVAETKDNLSALIDRALAGEEVIVTRHGKPVAAISAIPAPPRPPRPITEQDIAWLRSIRARVGTAPGAEDAGAFVSRMRDEDTH